MFFNKDVTILLGSLHTAYTCLSSFLDIQYAYVKLKTLLWKKQLTVILNRDSAITLKPASVLSTLQTKSSLALFNSSV